MDTKALFKIGYGLYVLTAHENGKDNGCIINTVMQVTSDPCMIAIAVNKQNYTNEMISRTRKFNVSTLAEGVSFDLFKRFGFQSGKDFNKFSDFYNTKRSPNGVLYITENTNSFISAYVQQEIDLKTHTMFIAQLVEAECLSDIPTVTYDFYQKNIKPRPEKQSDSPKKGWRCKICGYIYEGENLPQDFICPLCKHGAQDFEKI
jgi:flavin reductase (DIM6/NTAB) family NADH-FMN oxidoreductase RutF